MAKRSAKKPSKTPLQKAYNKERSRLKRQVQALEKRGYRFAKNIVPEIPKKITEASLRRVKNITLDDLYKKSRYYGNALDYETRTGGGTSGVRGRELERSFSAQRGAETRRRRTTSRLIDELARLSSARDYAREQGDRQSVNYIDEAIDGFLGINSTDYTSEDIVEKETDYSFEDEEPINEYGGRRRKEPARPSLEEHGAVENFREKLSHFAPLVSDAFDRALDRLIDESSEHDVYEALKHMPDTLEERIQSFNGDYMRAIQSYFDDLGAFLKLSHEERLELASLSDEYEDGYDI